jgi:putative ABC transport system substrate-binding protein
VAFLLAFLVAPSFATAQQADKIHRIGFLTAVSPTKTFERRLVALRRGLQELGYTKGRNILTEERYAKGRRKILPALAMDLVRSNPKVILTHGDSIAQIVDEAAKKAGKVIPIVLTVSSDPLGGGLVDSLARPGGNITGLTSSSRDLVQKRLQFLKEIVPSAVRIAVFWDSRVPPTVRQMQNLQHAAPAFGVKLIPIEFVKSHVDRAFDAVRRERPDALIVLGWGLTVPHTKPIANFALKNRLPAVFTSKRFVAAGGLISYGVDTLAMYRRAATYVHKILQGAKPAVLPVEQPTRYNLAINLKTAATLGVNIPQSILLQATEVIE